MCKFYGVSRSGYYAWSKREHENGNDLWLRDLIAECQQKHQRRYGYRRVALWLLREYGLIINHKTILRIMNKYGLLANIRRHRYFKQIDTAGERYPDLLKQDFSAKRPNQKWVTDITHINTREGWLYLSAIKDLYDGYIVGYKIEKTQAYGLVDRTIKAAISRQQSINGVILHSDQGYQYRCHQYMERAKEYGIRPSMSRPGTPLDNAPAESFFSILKCECLNRTKLKTFEEALDLVETFIYYYNNERMLVKNGLTPFEMRLAAGFAA